MAMPQVYLDRFSEPGTTTASGGVFTGVKKRAADGNFELLYLDKASVSLHSPLRACWQKRGQQRHIDRLQEMQHLFGSYNWHTDQVTVLPKPTKNAQHFIDFLEHLFLQVYPCQNLVLVLDNEPFHHSNQVKAFLSLFEHRVRDFWLPPPYSPHLNLIERFWKHLKDYACTNKLFHTLNLLLDNIHRLVIAQNRPGDPNRLSFAKFFP